MKSNKKPELKKNKASDKKPRWWVALMAVWLAVLLFILFFADTLWSMRDGLQNGVTVNFSNSILETQPFRAEMEFTHVKPRSLKILFVQLEDEQPVREPVTVNLQGRNGAVSETWQLEPDSILTDGRYTELPLENAKRKFGKHTVLTVTSAETDPTCAVRINMIDTDNGEVTAWYCAEEPQPEYPQVTFGYLIGMRGVLRTAAAWTAIGVLVLLLAVARRRGPAWSQWLLMIGFTVCSLPVTFCLVERLGGYAWADLEDPVRTLLLNALLYTALLLLFWGLTGSSAVGCSVGNGLMLAVGITNCYVKEARGTPFLPQDISGATTALGVADHLQLELHTDVVYAICWLFAVILISAVCNRRIRLKKRNILCRILMLVIGGAVTLSSPVIFLFWSGEMNLWNEEKDYTLNSVPVAFTKNFCAMMSKRPRGYNAKQLPQRVADAIDPSVNTPQNAALQKNAALTAERLPNIFVVMDESFTDVSTLVDLEAIGVTEPLLPNLCALEEDPAAHVGKTTVPVWGGGTCGSEYEMLTGFSYRIDNANGAPYLKYFKQDTPAIGQYMASLGYQTGALHLMPGKNWYRDRAYPQMGFEEITFSEQLEGSTVLKEDVLRRYCTDRTGYRLLNETLAEDAPQFRFYITVQNHSTYNGFSEKDDVEVVQTAGLSEEDETNVETYLTLMKCSDEQLGEWLGQLAQEEEPTVVVFFGDHWGCLDRNVMERLGTLGANKMNDETSGYDTIQYFSTPYVLWSNCGYDFSTAPDRLSLNYLSAVLMQQLGLPLTQWQQLQLTMMQEFPVYALRGVLNVDGKIVSSGDPALQEWTQLISEVHYNALKDPRNTQWDIFS